MKTTKETPKGAKAQPVADDLSWRLKLVRRQSKAVKDYQTYGNQAKGKRRKMAMDYVAPGDGGY